MQYEIIRVMENPPSDLLPSQKAKGVVEQISIDQANDGFHVDLTRTLWTRNRARRDERGDLIDTRLILRMTPQEAAAIVTGFAWTLIHVDSRGPRDDNK